MFQCVFFVCVWLYFFFREKKKDAILSLFLDVPFFFPLPLFFSVLSLPFSYHKFSLRAFCCFFVSLFLFSFFDVYSVAQSLSPLSHSFSFLSSSLLLCSFTTQH